MQRVELALTFARVRAGRSIPARTAMIAMTTNNSIRVNPAARVRVIVMRWTSKKPWFAMIEIRSRDGIADKAQNSTAHRPFPKPRELPVTSRREQVLLVNLPNFPLVLGHGRQANRPTPLINMLCVVDWVKYRRSIRTPNELCAIY